MSYNINKYTVKELANKESKGEVLLETNKDTNLHIETYKDCTVLSLPFGNTFNIIDGKIIIKKH